MTLDLQENFYSNIKDDKYELQHQHFQKYLKEDANKQEVLDELSAFVQEYDDLLTLEQKDGLIVF